MEYNEEPTVQYPLYFPCTKEKFNMLNKQANELLKFPENGTDDYAKPITDENNQIYFIVNNEVSSLVDLNKCVTFEQIVFNNNL